ncbi:hypothetical protein K0M31_006637 [Melipona bicolor]|uniref:Uncharacterized protein n=1 Tax=Melipona bicolor TaxID=60889 RepID=A0AA40FRY9_9HYME|nr:hypothetical protein K0M31_006637 [Melipona bicolor]
MERRRLPAKETRNLPFFLEDMYEGLVVGKVAFVVFAEEEEINCATEIFISWAVKCEFLCKFMFFSECSPFLVGVYL